MSMSAGNRNVLGNLKNDSPDGSNDWHMQLAEAVCAPEGFTRKFVLSVADLENMKLVANRYPVFATPYYLSLADSRDSRCPIRAQCVPDSREINFGQEYSPDPFGEYGEANHSFVIHRYRNRVVCVLTDRCAIRCRHCTRKNTLGKATARTDAEIDAMINYIKNHSEIREVIVSGGDPLVLETGELDLFLGKLTAIEHVQVLRIGTRVPVVLPMRVDEELCAMLRKHRPLWINTHFNHPAEITPASRRACAMLADSGFPVSNQTVLLKGVNNKYEILAELFNTLQAMCVRPYYMFQCDPVRGVAHFATDIEEGVRLAEKLRANLGGLSVPSFVADLPGTTGKTPVGK